IDTSSLQTAFAERMKAKYSTTTDNSVPHDRGTLTAFFTWTQTSGHAQKDAVAYLRSRFEKDRDEIAAFIGWLFPGDVAYDSNNPSVFFPKLFPQPRENAQP